MFGWFKKRSAGRLEPEARWVVARDEHGFSVTDIEGKTRTIARSELAGLAIGTNDSGPWGADVWWLLFDASGQLACACPQGATGEQALLDDLMALPGFDHSEMIKAMASTDNATFIVWRR